MSSRATNMTRLYIALRTSTRNARALAVIGRSDTSAASPGSSPARIDSHSATSDESVWRTSSPSHSTRSLNVSSRLPSGTVRRSARYASDR